MALFCCQLSFISSHCPDANVPCHKAGKSSVCWSSGAPWVHPFCAVFFLLSLTQYTLDGCMLLVTWLFNLNLIHKPSLKTLITGRYQPLNISTIRSMDKTQFLVPTFDICEVYPTRFDSKKHEKPISTCPLSLRRSNIADQYPSPL
jgi:hypothetical protein